jgi:hypothetical protein
MVTLATAGGHRCASQRSATDGSTLPEVVVVPAGIGTAVVLFPVAKRQSETAALGFVTARVLEASLGRAVRDAEIRIDPGCRRPGDGARGVSSGPAIRPRPAARRVFKPSCRL